jgi:F-type H+-transporting ATPase subunit c
MEEKLITIIKSIIVAHQGVLSNHVIAVMVLAAIPALVTGFAIGRLGEKFFEAVARQPEMRDYLAPKVFLFCGLIDTFAAISIGIGAYLLVSSPLKIDPQQIAQEVVMIQKVNDKLTFTDDINNTKTGKAHKLVDTKVDKKLVYDRY